MKSIRRTINSVIAELLCAGVLLGMFPIYAVATDLTIGQQGGYLAGSVKAVQNLYLQRNFSAPTGHGFVAEQAKIGDQWAKLAGKQYKYYMIFETRQPDYPGVYSLERFMEIVKGL